MKNAPGRIPISGWGFRRMFSLVLLALIFSLYPIKARAHEIELIRSEPEANSILDNSPPEVITWFNEEIQTGVSALTVFDAQGVQVDEGNGGVDLNDPDHASMRVRLMELPGGSYTVRWHAVLLDGDATGGEFVFQVAGASAIEAAQNNPLSETSVGEQITNTGRSPLLIPGLVILVLVLAAVFAGVIIYQRKGEPR